MIIFEDICMLLVENRSLILMVKVRNFKNVPRMSYRFCNEPTTSCVGTGGANRGFDYAVCFKVTCAHSHIQRLMCCISWHHVYF